MARCSKQIRNHDPEYPACTLLSILNSKQGSFTYRGLNRSVQRARNSNISGFAGIGTHTHTQEQEISPFGTCSRALFAPELFSRAGAAPVYGKARLMQFEAR